MMEKLAQLESSYTQAIGVIRDKDTELDEMRKRLVKMAEALMPFAKEADEHGHSTIADLHRARDTLLAIPGHGAGMTRLDALEEAANHLDVCGLEDAAALLREYANV